MSQKITGKNLSYSQNLPPFLARLQGQGRGPADGPDPILAGRRRAARPRDDGEDAPVVLDEQGNVVDDVRVGVDGSAVRTASGGNGEDDDGDGDDGEGGDKTAGEGGGSKREVGIGARKRKVAAGRVIGGGDEDDDGDDEVAGKKTGKGGKRKAVVTDHGADGETTQATATSKATSAASTGTGKSSSSKGQKKAKKIKLSFGDDGD
ncbi:hypothetical protein MCOR25_000639 [Pyricularia grisea]|uniref:DUF4604 domain-containing protein n=1 Tax=Pyricularia grisea TaxID=148305 RepID=A0A6P8AVM3_PYRGI|nr:uncharacterized protein PgNI_08100 [Pyricularia grisea]KAI6382639.1 hypothetical protein MCOR25_000639 [Pyricularia grisea]TLD06278.1 hypothetical protein PgNI_08100 [Pyricularia grisea]